MFETLQPFAISFFTGLLIGIERERAHAVGAQAIGVRTFVLLGLLGTLAAKIGEPALTLGLAAFALAAILAGYVRSTRPKGGDIGLTTEVSAGVVFALGYLSVRDPTLGAALGVVVLLVLVSRQSLHAFAREMLRAGEVNAAVILLVFGFVVIPFLPDRTLRPWGLANPRRLALMATTIAGLQFRRLPRRPPCWVSPPGGVADRHAPRSGIEPPPFPGLARVAPQSPSPPMLPAPTLLFLTPNHSQIGSGPFPVPRAPPPILLPSPPWSLLILLLDPSLIPRFRTHLNPSPPQYPLIETALL